MFLKMSHDEKFSLSFFFAVIPSLYQQSLKRQQRNCTQMAVPLVLRDEKFHVEEHLSLWS